MQNRIEPPCPHFNICGGCRFQDVSYPHGQIALKKRSLASLFKKEIEIIPSPRPFEYRNRMDFVCAFSKIGLRERGQFKQVVDIEECFLIRRSIGALLVELRKEIKRTGIPDYNYLNHSGYLRYIVFRAPAFTDDLMVSFITANDEEYLMPIIHLAQKRATSVNWLIHGGLADTSFGRVHRYFNHDHFREKIGDMVFQVGPNAFFQNNAYLVKNLFDVVKEHVKGRVLDLYCGIGSITCYITDACDHVTGVEKEEEAIRCANKNGAVNRVTNADFVCADVRKWLIENPKHDFQTVVLDPPRAGIGKKISRKIIRLGAEQIVYVSCNPRSFLADLPLFTSAYDLKTVLGFDMFPQTPHVEVVGVLVKKQLNR
jgi:23S rRNA (uracil-5-)-methyltransferase RumA